MVSNAAGNQTEKTANLLHVAEDVLAAVKDAFALLRVQVEDEVGGVVGIGVFIPISKKEVVVTWRRLTLYPSLSLSKTLF